MTMDISEPLPDEPEPEDKGPESQEPEDLGSENREFEGQSSGVPQLEEPVFGGLPPEEPVYIPPVRRRRRRSASGSGRGEYLDDLFHLTTAGFDFFLFALISGIVLVLAILLDSAALYLLAALIAPFMAPVVGMALGLASGSIGHFLRSLINMAIGGALMFGMGLVAGLLGPIDISQAGGQLLPTQTYQHMQFTWPDAAVLVLGVVVTVYLASRNPMSKPLVSSVAIAYELFLPLGVAGFGLIGGRSMPDLWPGGLVLFIVFIALAVAVGTVMFVAQGIHPERWYGALAGAVLFLGIVGGMVWLAAADWFGIDLLAASAETPAATATLEPTAVTTPTPLPTGTASPVPTAVPTETLIPPTATLGPTNTLLPTETATETLGPSPTPLWGLVNAGTANGVIIRADPNSTTVVATLLNGNLIQILPETVNKGGVIWIHVRTTLGLEGWVQAALIATATPRP